jgi:thymidylate kinase
MKFKNFFNFLFTFLDKKKIRYCILRNYENFPNSNSSKDIDILIDKRNLKKINNFLFRNFNVTTINERKSVFTYFLSDINDNKKKALQVDFITEVSWKGLKYLDNNKIFNNSATYKSNKLIKIPSPTNQVIIMFFSSYLIGGWINTKYQPLVIKIFKINKDYALNYLSKIAGKKLALKVLNYNFKKDYKSLLKILKYIKFNFIRKKLLENPLYFFINLCKHYIYEFRIKFTSYPLNEFCFLGIDGVGKTSIIKNIDIGLTGCAKEIKIIHLKHPFFKEKNLQNTNPHNKKKRNLFVSILKVVYWLFGYYFKKNIHGFKNSTIILWDRYIYDIWVDPLRYRLKLPKFLVIFFKNIAPKPDFTFILTDKPDRIFRRKKELSLKEIKKYNKRYIQLSKSLNSSKLINTSKGINKTSLKILNIIKKILNKKSRNKINL